MASINLSGILTRPDGEPDVGAVVRFTHYTTTGNTVKYSYSELVIPPDGAYNIDLEYGQVRIDYDSDYKTERFISFVVVNQDSTATSIPELLNASVPPTDEQLLEFQSILADTVAAKNIAVAVSEQITTTELINGSNSFTTGDVIETSGFTSKGDGGGAKWQLTSTTGTASQTPAQLGDALLNDADGRQWKLIHDGVLIIEKLGGVAALQASLNSKAPTVTWLSESINLDPVTYTIYSGQTLKGQGKSKSAMVVNAGLALTSPQFKNEAPNSATDGLRYDKGIVFSDFTVYCSNRVYPKWLSNSAGVAITDPEFDYTASGIIGQGGDIFDVVAADRRNPNYAQKGYIFRMIKVERPVIKNIRMVGMESFGVSDEGCLSMRVRDCDFEEHGKIDDIASAIYVQSYGATTGTDPWYQDSEDHVTEYCNFWCKRSAITLAPTKGGAFRFNNVYESGESAVFSGSVTNKNGGSVDVHDNYFGANSITDIVSTHIEANACPRYHVYNNFFENSDLTSVAMPGGVDNSVKDNTFKNCVARNVSTYPYGPFSERYGFGVGSDPIAGDTLDNVGIVQLGTLTVGCQAWHAIGNTFIDDRATTLASGVFEMYKAGSNNLSKNISLSNNDISQIVDTSIKLIYERGTSVVDSAISVKMTGNIGHSSSTGKTITHQVVSGSTDAVTIDCGFRPSSIDVYVTANNGALGSSCVGRIVWGGSGSCNPMNAGGWASVVDGRLYRLVSSTGSTTDDGFFNNWTLTGFKFTPLSSTNTINIRFVCNP